LKYKCAVLHELNKPLSLEYLEIPPLMSGQVLVKVHLAGLCGSQLNEIHGIKGNDKYLPHLLGHEGYGTVVDVGKDVTKVKSGDNVILTWIKCNGLEGGAKRYGKYNAGSITTFQEFSVISENRLVLAPFYNDVNKLALFGCMVPTGFGSVLNVNLGKSIRIFGVGNIGSAAIIAAKYASMEVYAVDISVDKLSYAKSLGADFVSLPKDNLSKVDVALDTTGNVKVIEQAFDSINDTGTLIVVGNGVGKVSFDPFEFIKGKKIVGSWGGNCNLDVDIDFFASIDISKIHIIYYDLDNINKAIEEFPTSCGKMLLRC